MAKAKKLIVANWKLNPETPREAKDLYKKTKKLSLKLTNTEVLVCAPSVFLGFLNHRPSKNLHLGVQDVGIEKSAGAFTGSLSAGQLKYAGAEYTIVGHSEKRASGDSDERINVKVKNALSSGLSVILCIGEKVRDTHGDYLNILKTQLELGLAGVKKTQFADIVIAYEPVWAIGKDATGVDTSDNFLHNALFIRKVISGLAGKEAAHAIKILYGGSVNPKNAEGFLGAGKADGLLVGRACLDPKNFGEILRISEVVAKTQTR